MMHQTHVVFLLLLLASPAMAQPIYRWLDEEGVTHYTNDAANVPKGQKAEVTAGDEISVISRPAPAKPSSAAEAGSGATAERGFRSEQDLMIEQQWRTAFRDAYSRIVALESTIEGDRRILDRHGGELPLRFFSAPIYGGFGMGWPEPWYDEIKQRIGQNEAELRRAREALSDLERYASRQAVPREWRH
jgi:hypothetical protein